MNYLNVIAITILSLVLSLLIALISSTILIKTTLGSESFYDKILLDKDLSSLVTSIEDNTTKEMINQDIKLIIKSLALYTFGTYDKLNIDINMYKYQDTIYNGEHSIDNYQDEMNNSINSFASPLKSINTFFARLNNYFYLLIAIALTIGILIVWLSETKSSGIKKIAHLLMWPALFGTISTLILYFSISKNIFKSILLDEMMIDILILAIKTIILNTLTISIVTLIIGVSLFLYARSDLK